MRAGGDRFDCEARYGDYAQTHIVMSEDAIP
jgi:hypothetical protein